MDILNKRISSFTYDDVVDFCKKGFPEGTQLDYKIDIPKSGLAKHFAAFSNQWGGVIILGVEEDKTTGIPIKFDGLIRNTKIIEQISQFASNVEPIPNYEIHITNEKNGLVFILIRIYEGERTPYRIQNHAEIWIRTGNISKSFDLASPEALELLFGKKEKAEKLRNIYINQAETVFQSILKQTENKRLQLIKNEKIKYIEANGMIPENWKSHKYYKLPLGGKGGGICKTFLLPYYPRQPLSSIKEIKEKINDIRHTTKSNYTFLSVYSRFNPIPDGLMGFAWNESTGRFNCEQVYSNGLLYHATDVVNVDEKDVRKVYLVVIASDFFAQLISARKFYNLFGYQGGIIGRIELSNMENTFIESIVPDNSFIPFFWDNEASFIDQYSWTLSLDTQILNNDSALKSFFLDKLKDIFWSVGYDTVTEDLLEKYYNILV